MFKILSETKARSLMSNKVISLTAESTVADAVKLMSENNSGSVVIQDKMGVIAGIFTERDLMRRVVAHGLNAKNLPLGEVMTREVETAQADVDAIFLLEKMCDNNFRHLPILEGDKLVGIISLKHFYRFFLESRQSMSV